MAYAYTGRNMGLARLFAIVFGLSFIIIALMEVMLGTFTAGFITIQFTLIQNVIHWLAGIALLAAGAAGERWSVIAARVFGSIFLVVGLLGVFAPTLTGQLLGFSGAIPGFYNADHLVVGVLGLLAGFVSMGTTRRYGMRRTSRIQ